MAKIQLACKGKEWSPIVTDYIMSEKFGLDWKNQDFQRMQDFILIQNIINKIEKDGSNGISSTNGR